MNKRVYKKMHETVETIETLAANSLIIKHRTCMNDQSNCLNCLNCLIKIIISFSRERARI